MLPSMPTAVERAASLLREQARSCAAMGSPLYASLLDRASEDVEQGGPVWAVLAPHLDVADRRARALALRLMAAVHRLVLTGSAPTLARHYPSAGGDGDLGGAWAAFRETLANQGERITDLLLLPCQTNEVGRAAGLAVGFLHVAAQAGLPWRLLEVGASAGLNLRWDRFRYGGGGVAWGPPDSPVDLDGMWAEAPAHVDATVEIADRRGCDASPVDPTTEEGRLTLQASLWADQVERFSRLAGAVSLAREVPAGVDEAPVDSWIADRLADPADGLVTVVFHSVVEEYLPDPVRDRFRRAVTDAGTRATKTIR
jgi:hypothetical protein